MGVFLFSTYELDSTGSGKHDKIFRKVLDYIIYSLNDAEWQEQVSKKVRTSSDSHRIIKIYLRLYNKLRVEQNVLKSYSKFVTKDECLIVDPIFLLDKYINLGEEIIRKEISTNLLSYLEEILFKYKDRFKDFDVSNFIDPLRYRMEEIKSNRLSYTGSNELLNDDFD
ncbi:HicA family toxin-antitoxin system [Sphingobacterium endophyticum]|uniref:HicA family toxin-antitoxin system n=1 Tax=Sphingobacterium endophyticum TaxID=2546448 RepID=UPI0012E0D09A|nr:HicA family toxin-antitoxin system [Sphingobacterium endophyticum]